ncbi:MAG: isochorismatase family cysteine hydrolase [Candidatus Acidiferrales bacterium]|jgi:nicotinamidase/pyrazinamidase
MKSSKVIFWEVDTQADFMLPGGKLYVPGAEKRIPNIERLVQAVREDRVFLVSSADAHAPNDPEFQVFPPHCVKGTPGAQIIPEGMTERYFTVPNEASFVLRTDILDGGQAVLEKQTLDVFGNPKASELVGLIGKTLGSEGLAGIEYVVFGVVTEYCVRCAAKGLLERGCKVAIVEDAIETLQPEQGRRALDELRALGARLITTDQAIALVGAADAQKVI